MRRLAESRRGGAYGAEATAPTGRRYETQRPAICASGDCPIALTIGSHPSSRRGLGAGAAGALISIGPFTALRLFAGVTCMRSLLSVRFTVVAFWPSEGAAVVADTSRPTRKQATAKAAPAPPTKNRELRSMEVLPRSLSPLVALTRR